MTGWVEFATFASCLILLMPVVNSVQVVDEHDDDDVLGESLDSLFGDIDSLPFLWSLSLLILFFFFFLGFFEVGIGDFEEGTLEPN